MVVVKKYIKKDGTVSEHRYKVKYVLSDKTNKVTRKQLAEKLKRVKKNELREVDEFLTRLINRHVQPNEQEILPGQ